MHAKTKKIVSVGLIAALCSGMTLGMTGCGQADEAAGKTVVSMIQYKQEALDIFDQIQADFNASHDDIYLEIESPSDAMTILKTRLIREEEPDIIGFGGDVNYSNFVDAGILMDLSDSDVLDKVNPAYLDILESLEYVPTEGTFGMPYAANAAGILYNRDMFAEYGWEIPTSWDEFTALCDQIQSEGIQPLYAGYKDTWTCLAPWNAIAIELSPSDVCFQVSDGETTFEKEYAEVADKMQALLQYVESGPFAYGYNDACMAFADGQSAMFAIGSYAVPQILSSNPDMNIGSFVMPAADSEEKLVLNSGIDLQFAISESCENKDAALEVLRFLAEDENVQNYITAQNSVSCLEGDFETSPVLDNMMPYIEAGRMADFQDHHYPSEMAVDAMIQTFLIEGDKTAFLQRFDSSWIRYNRDVIKKVQDYTAAHPGGEE